MTMQQQRTLLCSANDNHSRHTTSRTERSRSSSTLDTRTSSTSSESYRSVLREVVTACSACSAGAAGNVYWKDYSHQQNEEEQGKQQQQQLTPSAAKSSSAEETATATGKAGDTIQRQGAAAAPQDAALSLSRMRRASASRRYSRDNILGSPSMRSRSSERSIRASDDDVQQDGGGALEKALTKPEHRRCQSDIFDSQQDFVASSTESEDDDTSSGGGFAAVAPLPTLPRYPVQEQRNKNCWSVTDVEKFSVRGPAYFADQKKVQSGPYQLETRGSDLFLLDKQQQSKHNSSDDDAEDLCEIKYVKRKRFQRRRKHIM